jgi:hypothetical protein
MANLPKPFPLRRMPGCRFLPYSRPNCRQIAYSFPLATASVTGLLSTLYFPTCHSPERILRFPCSTRCGIAYSFSYPAAPLAGLLIAFPCHHACRQIAYSFPVATALLAGSHISFLFAAVPLAGSHISFLSRRREHMSDHMSLCWTMELGERGAMGGVRE